MQHSLVFRVVHQVLGLLLIATSNGISFKLTGRKLMYEGFYLNPKDIPPDDLDDVILGKIIKETGIWYRRELESQSIYNQALAG
jgi:hypothetical protein